MSHLKKAHLYIIMAGLVPYNLGQKARFTYETKLTDTQKQLIEGLIQLAWVIAVVLAVMMFNQMRQWARQLLSVVKQQLEIQKADFIEFHTVVSGSKKLKQPEPILGLTAEDYEAIETQNELINWAFSLGKE